MSTRHLNIGCGTTPIRDAINHSIKKHAMYVDVAWDLNLLPWPWPDASFEVVTARSVFEHLTIDLLHSMDETWRILVPGGRINLKLPYWKTSAAYSDPTHRYYFDPEVLDNFDPTTDRGQRYSFYTDRKWSILERVFVNEQKSSFFAVLRKIA